MRERAMVIAVMVALVCVAAACGSSADDAARSKEAGDMTGAHYVDAVGDSGALPDIRAIDVSSTPAGRITFRVALGQFTSRTSANVDLWLDTDADPETGNNTFEDADGAEFLFSALLGVDDSWCNAIPGGNGCLSQWSPRTWVGATAPTARVSRTASGVTLSIDRSDLGDTDELNFYAVVGGDPVERAPGRGTFNYSLAVGGPRPEASASSARANKAGGTAAGGPVVVTLASRDYNASEASEFASAVERLSDGALRIDIEEGYRYYDVDYEQGMIADVRSGTVDAAVVGARAWDAAGVESFNALVAPFLIDSYDLERRVLESDLPERMLGGVEPLGLVGLAVLPGELRRPLGLSRRLVRPADYTGARVGIRPSRVADATFDALGADAEGFRAIAEGLVGFDGAESGVTSILNNRYDRDASALTANVVLWPRPMTVVMNRGTFDALTDDEQDALRRAGLGIVVPLLATIEASERSSVDGICRGSRLPFVHASQADLRDLRRAVQPVYARLEGDPLTRELIDDIEALRGGSRVQPLRCPASAGSSVASALDGVWRVDLTRAELAAAGAQQEQFERSEGSWTVEFDNGRWVARNPETRHVYSGNYEVEGDVLRETLRSCTPQNLCTPGTVEEYTWSRYRDRLSLAPVPGRPYNIAAVAEPLSRVR